jgi:hypothetical protein
MNPIHENDPKGLAGSKKTPLHLLPPYALAQTALAHAEGAKRYGPWNWRSTKVCATTYIGAIKRHMDAWQDGEDFDPDLPGVSHLAKIAACCNILMDAQHCGTLVDDRSKVPTKARSAAFTKLMDMLPKMKYVEGEPPYLQVTQLGGPDSGFEQHETPQGMNTTYTGHTFCKKCGQSHWTYAECPTPPGLPPLPPIPEGYSRWEYRGKGWGGTGLYAISKSAGDAWLSTEGPANACGYDRYHYIEAVK